MSKSRDKEIITACGEGNLDLVKQLIEQENVNVDEVRGDWVAFVAHNYAPLHAACTGGHLEVVEYLVFKRRADVNLCTRYPPLHNAKSKEIIDFLIDNGADIEGLSSGGDTPLQYACFTGNLTQIQSLIDRGANKDVVSKYGNTLLHLCKTINILDYLVSQGLDFNKVNKWGDTPLHNACRNPNLDVVQYFAHKGVDINEINTKTGLTPRETVLKSLDDTLKGLLGVTPNEDPEILNNPQVAFYTQPANSTISFIDTWNRKVEFVEEVGDFADERWLSNMLFQSYCSGEAMTEPSEQG